MHGGGGDVESEDAAAAAARGREVLHDGAAGVADGHLGRRRGRVGALQQGRRRVQGDGLRDMQLEVPANHIHIVAASFFH